MWFIWTFSSTGRFTQRYIILHEHHTSSFPLHWICMNTNANSQHECASTKDIWLKGGNHIARNVTPWMMCRKWVQLRERIDGKYFSPAERNGYHFVLLQYYVHSLKQWEKAERDWVSFSVCLQKETSSIVNHPVPRFMLWKTFFYLSALYIYKATLPYRKIREPWCSWIPFLRSKFSCSY